jgi:hypothetical protein
MAGTWAGVGKSTARPLSHGDGGGVLVTIAATEPVALDANGALCTGIATALRLAADPAVPVTVLPAALLVICLSATVVHDPLAGAGDVLADVRAALLSAAGYGRRELDQDVAVGDLIAAAHTVAAVRSFTVTGLVLVPGDASASALTDRLPALLSEPVPAVVPLSGARDRWQPAGDRTAAPGAGTAAPAGPAPSAVAYLTGEVDDTVLLTADPR